MLRYAVRFFMFNTIILPFILYKQGELNKEAIEIIMFETVSVIGGDLRQLTLARLLRTEGYHVFLYGFDKDNQLDDSE